MDKIWIETLGRISELEKRMALIEELATEPLEELKAKAKSESEPEPEPKPETFPERVHREVKEEIEGHKPDKTFKDGIEQESKPESE